jgi:hypothetical protein
MMRCLHSDLAIGLTLFSLACRTAHPRPDVPALIVGPTPHSRAALRQAVSTALGGVPVTLADDALTHASTLFVEHARRYDPSGLPANGRQFSAPERFQLVKSGSECALVHERTGKRFALAATHCSPRASLE